MAGEFKIHKIKKGTFGNCKICNGLDPVANMTIPHEHWPSERSVKVCQYCAIRIINELKEIITDRLLGLD